MSLEVARNSNRDQTGRVPSCTNCTVLPCIRVGRGTTPALAGNRRIALCAACAPGICTQDPSISGSNKNPPHGSPHAGHQTRSNNNKSISLKPDSLSLDSATCLIRVTQDDYIEGCRGTEPGLSRAASERWRSDVICRGSFVVHVSART